MSRAFEMGVKLARVTGLARVGGNLANRASAVGAAGAQTTRARAAGGVARRMAPRQVRVGQPMPTQQTGRQAPTAESLMDQIRQHQAAYGRRAVG